MLIEIIIIVIVCIALYWYYKHTNNKSSITNNNSNNNNTNNNNPFTNAPNILDLTQHGLYVDETSNMYVIYLGEWVSLSGQALSYLYPDTSINMTITLGQNEISKNFVNVQFIGVRDTNNKVGTTQYLGFSEIASAQFYLYHISPRRLRLLNIYQFDINKLPLNTDFWINTDTSLINIVN